MKKQQATLLILFILVVFVLIIAGYFLYNRYYKENMYNNCMEACEENNDCLKYEIKFSDKDIGIASQVANKRECLEWSKGSCKNICVQKYK
jgi:purine-cytosine permease-like protein